MAEKEWPRHMTDEQYEQYTKTGYKKMDTSEIKQASDARRAEEAKSKAEGLPEASPAEVKDSMSTVNKVRKMIKLSKGKSPIALRWVDKISKKNTTPSNTDNNEQ